MKKWVLLYSGKQPPEQEPNKWIGLAMADGEELWMMYRFVKNIKGRILAYCLGNKENS